MTDTRETTDTDPRYHAAFQRGYDGPAPERGARAEARFRRPGRREEAAPRPRTAVLPTTEPVLDPVRSLGVAPPVERTASLPAESEDEPPQEAEGTEPPSWRATDVRVPLALVVMGVLLIVLGAVVIWSGSSIMYSGASTASERFAMYVVNFVPGPAVTVGLLSIGAALAVRAVRR
ncbi:hypothetical protein NB037_11920 [Rathayibacter sp. ZW T2_19]|uniref:Uncharacterized protein n=1 Tax=Rathayibacter rubneri TaxID=2950106 RepID=A0A9X2IUZ4_9MICO|nr:hypothetical protein [Rathayibacter rubneri]MCM6763124.1 hypothetical protein [Rathayibacter rubneri]